MLIQFPEARPHFAIPKGYGFHRLGVPELKEMQNLLDTLQIFEYPRKGHRYIMPVDVADGIGKDRSSIDIIRVGTVDEVEEQVAHFVSDRVPPRQLAYICHAIGNLYKWPDDRPALAAVELNNHGMSVQDTLQLHLGYTHFYVWEVVDQADPSKRFTTKIGWTTTTRTRPMLLDQLYTAVTTIDPISGFSDLRVNSGQTLQEFRDFQTEGALWEAEAARGAHDDCVMSLAIGHFVAWRLAAGEHEPLADRRRRRHEEEIRRLRKGDQGRRDYRNSDSLAEESKLAGPVDPNDEEQDDFSFYDPDGRSFGGTLY